MKNREILFRGKRIDSGEWVEGGYCQHQNRTLCAMGDSLKPEDTSYLILKSGFSDWNMPKPLQAYPVNPETVGQFTDQLDKNEKRVFVGDKVSAFGGNIFNVIFYKSAFQLEQAQTKVIVPFSTFDGNFEVIGTIHDDTQIK